ncbi:hypothetical protein HN51_017351, partial [Arachis hypogaea]
SSLCSLHLTHWLTTSSDLVTLSSLPSPRQSSLSISHSSLRRSLGLSSRSLISVVAAVLCPCVRFISGKSRQNQSSSSSSLGWWSSSSCVAPIAVSESVNQ